MPFTPLRNVSSLKAHSAGWRAKLSPGRKTASPPLGDPCASHIGCLIMDSASLDRLRRVVALAIVCATSARAQVTYDSVRTLAGYCRIYRGRPVAPSRTDFTYCLCDVDHNPKRLSGPDLPTVLLGFGESAEIGITIRPDGTVDSALTTLGSTSGDTSFAHHVLDAVRQWRFEPPLRNGTRVRLGLGLQISTNGRNDTLPSRLEWRYAEGRGLDSAIGRWVVDSERPRPLTKTQTDSVDVGVIRELLSFQVLIRKREQRYCIVGPSNDPLAVRGLDVVAAKTFGDAGPTIVTAPGCERDPALLRLVLPSIYRTERNRVVLFLSGDFLAVWPPNLDGTSWRAWSGRCFGRILDSGRAVMECGVNPISFAAGYRPYSMSMPRAPWTEGDSVRFTVLLGTI